MTGKDFLSWNHTNLSLNLFEVKSNWTQNSHFLKTDPKIKLSLKITVFIYFHWNFDTNPCQPWYIRGKNFSQFGSFVQKILIVSCAALIKNRPIYSGHYTIKGKCPRANSQPDLKLSQNKLFWKCFYLLWNLWNVFKMV